MDGVSPLAAGLKAACPRCGEGKLFNGYLTLAERCNNCGLDYSKADSGDGPAVFIILIVGALLGVLTLWLDSAYDLSYGMMLTILGVLSVGVPLLLLRPFKATMIALQYTNKAAEGRLDD